MEEGMHRAIGQVLYLWLRPVDLAACACVNRGLAKTLSQGRHWQTLHRRLWPSCTERDDGRLAVADWRTLAIQRDILDKESVAGFAARKAYSIFASRFHFGTLPVTLRLVSLNFFDGGRSGISGACSVALTCVVAVYLAHSAAPLYLSHEYNASGYNDDPTVDGSLTCSTTRAMALRLLSSQRHQISSTLYRSAWIARARAAGIAGPRYGGGDQAVNASFAVPRGRVVMKQSIENAAIGSGAASADGLSRAMADLLSLIPDDVQEIVVDHSVVKRRGKPEKRSRTSMHIMEVILRFCEAVRALNDGLSSITSDTLKKSLLAASNSPLLDAVVSKRKREVMALLADGKEDVNFRSRVSHLTPLLAECNQFEPDAEIVAALLNAGADCHAVDKQGRSPLLSLVSRREGAKALAVLARAGADVQTQDGCFSAFEVACRVSNCDAAAALVSAGAKVDTSRPLLRIILSNGGRDWNCKVGADVTKLLLDVGYRVDEAAGSLLILTSDAQVMRVLVAAGANVNHPDDPLAGAVAAGSLVCVQTLLELGAAATTHLARLPLANRGFSSFGKRGKRGTTGWGVGDDDDDDDAAQIVAALVAAGADVHAHLNGTTALHICASNDMASSVRLLLAHGAVIDAVDGDGETPLALALFKNGKDKSLEAAGVLVDAGAALDLPLLMAAAPLDAPLARAIASRLMPLVAIPPAPWGALVWLVGSGHITKLAAEKFSTDTAHTPKWTDVDVQALCGALESPLCKLQSIDLAYQDISNVGVAQLAAALNACATLTSINLIGCTKVDAAGCRVFIDALERGAGPALRSCSLVFIQGAGFQGAFGAGDGSWKVGILAQLEDVMKRRALANPKLKETPEDEHDGD